MKESVPVVEERRGHGGKKRGSRGLATRRLCVGNEAQGACACDGEWWVEEREGMKGKKGLCTVEVKGPGGCDGEGACERGGAGEGERERQGGMMVKLISMPQVLQ